MANQLSMRALGFRGVLRLWALAGLVCVVACFALLHERAKGKSSPKTRQQTQQQGQKQSQLEERQPQSRIFSPQALEFLYKKASGGAADLVYVSFWAKWCEPCIAELGIFEKWSKSRKFKSVKMLLVHLDNQYFGHVPDIVKEAKQLQKLHAPSVASLYSPFANKHLKSIKLPAVPYHIVMRGGQLLHQWDSSVALNPKQHKQKILKHL